MTTNKYPNADTSKERLAQIVEWHRTTHPLVYEVILRDLLAMIEERDVFIAQVMADEEMRKRFPLMSVKGGLMEPELIAFLQSERAHTLTSQYMKDKDADELQQDLKESFATGDWK